MDLETKDMLAETLNAVERLLNIFRIERIMYLILTAVSSLMLFYAIWLILTKNDLNVSILNSLFGSSGLIVFSSARITIFFNKAFKLVDDIIQSIIKPGEGNEKR